MNKLMGLILSILFFLGCGKLSTNPLDETYFPAGLGYEWVYERENYVWEESGKNDKTFDTLHIKVVSIESSRGWTTYRLEGGSEEDEGGDGVPGRMRSRRLGLKVGEEGFIDVGEEVLTDGNRVVVFDGQDTLPLVPPKDFKPRTDVVGYGVRYRGDTLDIGYDVGGGYELTIYSAERLKGVGAIRQEFEIRSPPHYEGHIDRLLYFIKNRDTAYKCPDCP